MMWMLLQFGIINTCREDSPWDGSMRFMRYLAVLVGWLWGLLAGERTRVSPHLSFLFLWLIFWGLQGDCLEREQNQMKKDLAEVKAYAEAMAESNHVRDVYVDKEQDKFFQHLNRQRGDIDTLKECMEWLELRARALELENKLMSACMNSIADKLCFCTWVEVMSQVGNIVVVARSFN